MQVIRLRLSGVKCGCRWARFSSWIASFLLAVPVLVLPPITTGQASSQIKTAVVFYADPRVAETLWAPLFDAFRAQVAEERQEYPLPEDFDLIRASTLEAGQEFPDLIEVRLVGRCDVAEQAYRPLSRGPLGWVVRASGEIQPFIYVDCGRLAQYLGPVELGMNEVQRRAAMATAISRVAIHEWIHIETQSGNHENRGLRQAELNSHDLIGTSRIPGGR